jgi:hypothetical protein
MMRRTALVVLLSLLVATAAAVSPAAARPTAENPSDVAADFNHDGFADLAIGAPGENGVAGAVNVLYGAGAGLQGTGAQVFFQVGSRPEAGDRFGSAYVPSAEARWRCPVPTASYAARREQWTRSDKR